MSQTQHTPTMIPIEWRAANHPYNNSNHERLIGFVAPVSEVGLGEALLLLDKVRVACNSYASNQAAIKALREALEKMLEHEDMPGQDAIRIARAALKLARESQ